MFSVGSLDDNSANLGLVPLLRYSSSLRALQLNGEPCLGAKPKAFGDWSSRQPRAEVFAPGFRVGCSDAALILAGRGASLLRSVPPFSRLLQSRCLPSFHYIVFLGGGLRNRWGFDAVGRGEVVVTARWHYDKLFKRRTSVLGSAFMGGKAKARVAAAAAAAAEAAGGGLGFHGIYGF